MKIRITDIHSWDAYAKVPGIVGKEGRLIDYPVDSAVMEDGWKFLKMNDGKFDYVFFAVKYEQV